MSDTSNLYAHYPLPDARSIRLLRVTKLHEAQLHKLSIELKVVHLDGEDLDFDALSYTWDSPIASRECDAAYAPENKIWIDVHAEKSFAIGRNLYEGLQSIWSTGRRRGRWLWVDAVCINQDDYGEKSRQIAMMAEIYAKAAQVIAWLGVEGPGHRIVDQLRWFHNTFIPHVKSYTESTGEPIRKSDFEEIGPAELRHRDFIFTPTNVKLPAQALVHLFCFYGERRYFQRAWIIQELLFAKKTIMLIADEEFDMDSVIGLATIIRTSPIMIRHLFVNEYTGELNDGPGLRNVALLRHTGVEALQSIKARADIESGGAISSKASFFEAFLYVLFIITSSSKVKDPRDHIYALIGLARYLTQLAHAYDPNVKVERTALSLETLTPTPVLSYWNSPDRAIDLEEYRSTASITADYSLPTKDVFVKFTQEFLEALPNGEIFSLVGESMMPPANNTPLELPSWVPDFRDLPQPMLDRFQVWTRNDHHPWDASKSARQNATEPEPISYHFEGNKLRVRARYCLSVRKSYTRRIIIPPNPHNNAAMHQALLNQTVEILTTLQSLGPSYPTGVSIIDAQIQTDLLSTYPVSADLRTGWAAQLLSHLATARIFGLEFGELIDAMRQLAVHHEMPDLRHVECLINGNSLDRDVFPEDFPHCDECPDKEKCWEYSTHHGNFAQLCIFALNYSFATEKGYIGTSHSKTEEGDELWLICGSKIPFVFRPVGNGEYKMVSQAFVCGAMLGEFVDNAIAGEPEEIVLI